MINHYCDLPTFTRFNGYETHICPKCQKPNTFYIWQPEEEEGRGGWKLVSPYIAWIIRLLKIDKG